MNRLCCAALLLLCAALPAGAKTAADCEAIKNPMEINLCLASLSPVRGSPEARRRGRQAPGGAEATVPAGVRGGQIKTVRRGGRVSSQIVFGAPVQRSASGRKRLSFDR